MSRKYFKIKFDNFRQKIRYNVLCVDIISQKTLILENIRKESIYFCGSCCRLVGTQLIFHMVKHKD